MIFSNKLGFILETSLFLYKLGGKFSTVDLLIKVACYVKKVNNILNIKRS